MVSVDSFAVCGPDAVSDMSGSDKNTEPVKRPALHLCPWCKAHVDEHDAPGLAECSKKWRELVSR